MKTTLLFGVRGPNLPSEDAVGVFDVRVSKVARDTAWYGAFHVEDSASPLAWLDSYLNVMTVPGSWPWGGLPVATADRVAGRGPAQGEHLGNPREAA